MSTHAITTFKSREWDGETIREVAHFWRKFDGHPTGHGAALKRSLGTSRFETLWDLVGAVTGALKVKIQGINYDWMFVPFDPHDTEDAHAEFRYSLSLVDRDGEMPRGGQCAGKYHVHVEISQNGRALYSGLLRDYIPQDPPDPIEEENPR